jgi:hypothetical protein
MNAAGVEISLKTGVFPPLPEGAFASFLAR